MSLKKWIHGLLAWAVNLFHSLEKEEKKLLPLLMAIVTNVKKFEDSGTGDVITKIIPGELDDKLYAKAKAATEKVFLALSFLMDAEKFTDPNEKYKYIISKIRLSGDIGRNISLHGFAAAVLEALSDGKISWNESIHIADIYFKEIYNKPGEEKMPVKDAA